ncbi:MAG: hypothetical protein A2787_01595 [Omnitrophica WOR_2 bacterium RIFCSPHIGHO2_01_FULL_48_9]|nr:MAG: hypothetical protein A3D10_06160 [Omnitrophica WOR_2 bacterium RIFCSPHIGHO2_02_FULL_48_11]OGX34083.1 MAG: hypothetical protein A2787_01595 [Omnitrophica WOR_2 bacterium RIFCSPHIGHO2_01_FULL_48_9]
MQLFDNKTPWREIIINTVFAFLMGAGILYIQSENPFVFAYLTTEDWWGEFATAVAYVLSAMLILLAMKNEKAVRKPGYGLMAFGFFFIGMEEINWGQRLLRIATPDVISKFNYQSEINLHNTVFLPVMTIFCYVLIVWIFILPVLVSRVKIISYWNDRLNIPRPSWPQVPYFFLAMFIFIFNPLVNHEPGELMLSLAFLNFATGIYFDNQNKMLNIRRPGIISFCVLAILLVTMTGLLVSVGSRKSTYNWRLHFMASKEYPDRGLYKQAEMVFEYMVDNPEFKDQKDIALDYAIFLQGIGSPKVKLMLQKALQEQYRCAQQNSEQPGCYRNAGIVLRMQNDMDRAQEEFQKAIKKDKMRLQKATLAWEKSYILFSLGKTYVEMGGNTALALQYLREARELTSASREKDNIKQWILRAEQSIRKEETL